MEVWCGTFSSREQWPRAFVESAGAKLAGEQGSQCRFETIRPNPERPSTSPRTQAKSPMSSVPVGVYAQEQFKLRPNVTLTAGVRWDPNVPASSRGSRRRLRRVKPMSPRAADSRRYEGTYRLNPQPGKQAAGVDQRERERIPAERRPK